jgi:hypothetical protein
MYAGIHLRLVIDHVSKFLAQSEDVECLDGFGRSLCHHIVGAERHGFFFMFDRDVEDWRQLDVDALFG